LEIVRLLSTSAAMMYFVVGSALHVTKPMDDVAVARVMRFMQYSASLLGLIALSFFGVFAFHQKNEHPGTL
jgi:hypothetical protein